MKGKILGLENKFLPKKKKLHYNMKNELVNYIIEITSKSLYYLCQDSDSLENILGLVYFKNCIM